MEFWRVLDTGLRPAAQNIALNRALLEARQADEIPSTLRFLRFTPSALLGYHQSAGQELNLDYCRANNIAVQRRITGGGAIYFDETQIGWELYLHKRDVGTSDMQAISKRICHAAATAISALGVDARFRPRNDIEVDGRKISGTGGAFDGNALMFQGTLLIDFDVEKMLRVLRIPAEKLSDKAIASARERVANLRELLGRQPDIGQIRRNITEAFESEFNVEFREGELTLSEHARYQAALREIDTPDWIDLVSHPADGMPVLEAVQKFAGGLLRAAVVFDALTRTVRQIWFTGDIFVNPRRTVADLEAALRDIPIDRLESRIRAFFSGRQVDMLSLTPDDFVTVVRLALRQPLLTP
ncbi:MAG TPA: biotin/lipoate A/B protein ligase family protein [Burkholderiales bacterium]|nr:biotin/lipoate A/B protein ligase family protein [Burkholderiales bacterium]